MKTIARLVRLLGLLWLAGGAAMATTVSMGLVNHPVYLGDHAQAGAIPLSAVPVWSNYGYGTRSVISAPRAFPGGPLESERGWEFDMNLASVYGIEVVPEDDTQVPQLPVTLKVGQRELSPEAKYSREQALVATLWSLILTVPGDEKTPLAVKVESDDPAHEKYAGEYVLAGEGLELEKGEIAGSRLMRDSSGVVWVVFGDEENEPEVPGEVAGARVAFVPVRVAGGDAEPEEVGLVPHWVDGTDDAGRLGMLWTALPRGMNALSSKRGANANPLHDGPFDAQHLVSGDGTLHFYSSASPEVDAEVRRLFAAVCQGAVLTVGAEEKPLEITFRGYPTEEWEVLAGDGWEREEGPHGGATWRRVISGTKAVVAGYGLVPRREGGWWLAPAEPELPEFDEEGEVVEPKLPGRGQR